MLKNKDSKLSEKIGQLKMQCGKSSTQTVGRNYREECCKKIKCKTITSTK